MNYVYSTIAEYRKCCNGNAAVGLHLQEDADGGAELAEPKLNSAVLGESGSDRLGL